MAATVELIKPYFVCVFLPSDAYALRQGLIEHALRALGIENCRLQLPAGINFDGGPYSAADRSPLV